MTFMYQNKIQKKRLFCLDPNLVNSSTTTSTHPNIEFPKLNSVQEKEIHTSICTFNSTTVFDMTTWSAIANILLIPKWRISKSQQEYKQELIETVTQNTYYIETVLQQHRDLLSFQQSKDTQRSLLITLTALCYVHELTTERSLQTQLTEFLDQVYLYIVECPNLWPTFISYASFIINEILIDIPFTEKFLYQLQDIEIPDANNSVALQNSITMWIQHEHAKATLRNKWLQMIHSEYRRFLLQRLQPASKKAFSQPISTISSRGTIYGSLYFTVQGGQVYLEWRGDHPPHDIYMDSNKLLILPNTEPWQRTDSLYWKISNTPNTELQFSITTPQQTTQTESYIVDLSTLGKTIESYQKL